MLRQYTFYARKTAHVKFFTVANSLEEAIENKTNDDGEYDTYDWSDFEWLEDIEPHVEDLHPSRLEHELAQRANRIPLKSIVHPHLPPNNKPNA